MALVTQELSLSSIAENTGGWQQDGATGRWYLELPDPEHSGALKWNATGLTTANDVLWVDIRVNAWTDREDFKFGSFAVTGFVGKLYPNSNVLPEDLEFDATGYCAWEGVLTYTSENFGYQQNPVSGDTYVDTQDVLDGEFGVEFDTMTETWDVGDKIWIDSLTVQAHFYTDQPDAPSITSPTDGAECIPLTGFTLEADAYSHHYGTAHADTQWRINEGDILDATSGSATTSYTYNGADLDPGTEYDVQVRYQDADGNWSPWSDYSAFTTVSAPATPSIVSPADGATGLTSPVTITASAYDDPCEIALASSRWQVATDDAFSSEALVIDDTDTPGTTSRSDEYDEDGTQYWARVRYQNGSGLWSDWSTAVTFTMATAPASIRLYNAVILDSSVTYKIQVRHAADDSIEEHTITSPAGSYSGGDTLEIDGTWDTVPTEYDEYSIGEDGSVVKPFRITRMERMSDNWVSIEAEEYDAGIYDSYGDIIKVDDYSTFPDPRARPEHVTGVRIATSASYVPEVYVSWKRPDFEELDDDTGNVTTYAAGQYDHAEIYLSEDEGSSFIFAGKSRTNMYKLPGTYTPGDYVHVKVVSVSIYGIPALISEAPEAFEVVKPGILPPAPTGLELVGQAHETSFYGSSPEVIWKTKSHSTAEGPIGRGSIGVGQGSEDWWIKGYRVQVWIPDYMLREEIVNTNRYKYWFDSNVWDNRYSNVYHDALGNDPARSLWIFVWTLDVFNQQSADKAWIAISNDAPAALFSTTSRSSAYIVGDDPDGGKFLLLKWVACTEVDFKGYVVYRCNGMTDDPETDGELVYQGDSSQFLLNGYDSAEGTNFYVAAYDDFGTTGLNYGRIVAPTIV